MNDYNTNGFELQLTPEFIADYQKMVKKDKSLIKKFTKALELLSSNPYHNSLRSHKVDTIDNNNVWSSSVTGDIRVIWIYDTNQKMVIVLLESGTHSGANKVYK